MKKNEIIQEINNLINICTVINNLNENISSWRGNSISLWETSFVEKVYYPYANLIFYTILENSDIPPCEIGTSRANFYDSVYDTARHKDDSKTADEIYEKLVHYFF